MKSLRLWLALVLLAWLSAWTPQASAARLQRWLYYSSNLWVDSNITTLAGVLRRAAAAGYTHVLLSDSKFSRLGDMDAHYFSNVASVKNLAASLGLEIVPAVFPVGYSNDILFNDPNLIEAMPATNALLVVSNGLAIAQMDPTVSFPGGDFSNLSLWSWKDTTVVADNGTARVTDPQGQNARIVQTLQVTPFRQYHISVRIKTQSFLGTPEIKVLVSSGALNYNPLGVLQTQDWQTHHVVFNSLTNRQVTVYFGCWDGTTGSLWWDDARIEEVAFLNLVRRPGAPLVIQRENGTNLVEGADYPVFKDPLMGVKPWNGCYDVYHTPPVLAVNLPDGTRLRASWHHAVTVYDGQAMICPSEPATLNWLQDQARRLHAAWGAKGYMMSHDEIRVMNWCAACQQRHLDAGAMLATNVQSCIQILRTVNPGGDIYVWSDMFDPYHNAHNNYYLVRGNLAGSWLGLDPQVIILPWDLSTRTNSLQFFAGRGHRQVLAGYYDSTPSQITQWLNAAQPLPGILGVMYTTWQSSYGNLEAFSGVVSDFEIHHSWQLGAKPVSGGLQLELPTLSGQAYS
ncbi:MAG TPA: hypothetical protein VNZ22_17290, partial [Bacillota bacterium]|nr:hypothetical protein [Bacillota bacterium]